MIDYSLKNIIIVEKPSIKRSLLNILPSKYEILDLFGDKIKAINIFSKNLQKGSINIFICTDPSIAGEMLYRYFIALASDKAVIDINKGLQHKNINQYRICLEALSNKKIIEAFKEDTIIKFNNLNTLNKKGAFKLPNEDIIFCYENN